MKFKIGDTAYIVENNFRIREVVVLNAAAGFYLVKPVEQRFGGMRLRESRVSATEKEAAATIRKNKDRPDTCAPAARRNPWAYSH